MEGIILFSSSVGINQKLAWGIILLIFIFMNVHGWCILPFVSSIIGLAERSLTCVRRSFMQMRR